MGEKQKALEYYNQALPLILAVGDRGGEATTLNNIGSVYDDLGEKQKALEYFNQALPLIRAVGNRGGEAATLNNIGKVYNDLGEKQKALEYFNQALPLIRAVGNRGGEATTLNNIGLVYSDLGEKQKPLEYYNQALPLLRAVGDRRGEANTLNNIGKVYNDLGEKQKALEYFNQALRLTRAVGDRGGEATTLNNIGSVYDDLGEKQKALEYYNQALRLTRAVGDRGREANTLSNIAVVERDQGNLQQALTQIEAAIKIIEDLRTKIASQELRTSYFASVHNYYNFYIDLLMQLHKQNPSKGYNALALKASERSHARGLVELLAEANVDVRKGVAPNLLAESRRLQQLIDAREKLLSQLSSQKQPSDQAIALTKKELDNFLNQQQELKVKIRTTNPEYADLKYPNALTLPQIQQQLDQDTLLLEYSLGEKHSYLWAVTPNSFETYELPGREQIKKAACKLSTVLRGQPTQGATPQEKAQAVADTTKAASELSQLILARVADKLGQKRLAIVADGILYKIPFAVLTKPTKSVTDAEYQPLIVNHEIVNLPSVSSLATHRQKLKGRKMASKTLAILADPVFSAEDSRVTGKPQDSSSSMELNLERSALQRSAKNLNRGSFDRLPGTGKEAREILKLVSSSDHLQAFDFDANYNWATNKQLSQYRIIHFATHGIIDEVNPELSGILMSLVDKQGKPQKGFLRLNDIFNLDIPAELVVLSACESGLGKDVQGEGLVGLTRGLMYAGSARIAVSLWNVSDNATPQLMSEFYQEMLQHKLSPTAALRSAQLKMWQQKDWQNPHYWAAFTLQGEWR